MKISKLTVSGIGEIPNITDSGASYILKNIIRKNALEKTPLVDEMGQGVLAELPQGLYKLARNIKPQNIVNHGLVTPALKQSMNILA